MQSTGVRELLSNQCRVAILHTCRLHLTHAWSSGFQAEFHMRFVLAFVAMLAGCLTLGAIHTFQVSKTPRFTKLYGLLHFTPKQQLKASGGGVSL